VRIHGNKESEVFYAMPSSIRGELDEIFKTTTKTLSTVKFKSFIYADKLSPFFFNGGKLCALE
jgi:hypothetical protein